MTEMTKTKPGPLSRLFSVCLGGFILGSFAIAGWRFLQGSISAEISGVQLLTPVWFWPFGAAVAFLGLLLATVFAYREKTVKSYVVGVAFMAFVPAVLYGLIVANGTTNDSPQLATIMGVLFVAAPWLVTVGMYFDRKARLSPSVR
jgi:hypothetical protein